MTIKILGGRGKKNRKKIAIANSHCDFPVRFYRLVKKRTKSKKKIPALKTEDGRIITSNAEKCELLSQYYASVFTEDNGVPLQEEPQTENELLSVAFTETKVRLAMNQMKNNFSRGPDGFPSAFIKQLSDHLAGPFSLLFNLCMEKGELPKVAHMTGMRNKVLVAHS